MVRMRRETSMRMNSYPSSKSPFSRALTSLCRPLAPTILGILATLSALRADAVDWLVGANQEWSTAVGQISPIPEALEIIEATKAGLFVEPDDAGVWQERVLGFMNRGLMSGRTGFVFLAPGIDFPAYQMSKQLFDHLAEMLAELGGLPGERILAYITGDYANQFELWTTEAIYAQGYGGGIGRVEKMDTGFLFSNLTFDGDTNHLKVIRFWDLALSNDTAEDVKRPQGSEISLHIVKLFLERTIEPKAATTIFATDVMQTDHLLFIQNECRRFLSTRIAKTLQKDKPMVTNHSGFRCAKWGTSFEETSKLLMPFLLHDSEEPFVASRLTSDMAILYRKHLGATDGVANTIQADLWPSIFELRDREVTKDRIERIGITRATRHFAGQGRKLADFVETTGIPVAPNFDYWSYIAPFGTYTAWFIDDQFYAVEIVPSRDTAENIEAVMAELTKRYGDFIDRPGEIGKSHYVHEDADGGILVLYEPNAKTNELKRIYHYSLKLRPMVHAKLAKIQADAQSDTEAAEAAKAGKAPQF